MIQASSAFIVTLVCLQIGLLAQTQMGREPSAQEEVVLSYFRDVVDGAKIDALEKLLLPDCAIHRPEGDLKGIAAMRIYARC